MIYYIWVCDDVEEKVDEVDDEVGVSESQVRSSERPLTRQLREAQKIANDIPSASGQLINGRNEHIAPAFQQLTPRDILGRDTDRRNGL